MATAIFFVATFMLFVVLALPRGDRDVAVRLASISNRVGNQPVLDDPLNDSFVDRVVAPLITGLVEQVRRLTPQSRMAQIRRRMSQAGQSVDPAKFVMQQVAGAAVLGLVCLVPALLMLGKGQGQALLLPVIGVVLGWRLPGFSLARRTKARQKELARMLPDVMDVLSVSVEAGLGFDGAMQKVSEKFAEPIASEFGAYLASVRLGTPRAEALRGLAERSGLPDLQTFVAAIIQADQLGVSIGRVLKGQSEALRQARRQKAEEKAMQLPLKLLFPLVLFIFPTLFLVLLGPAALHLIDLFTGGAIGN